jgi:beta-1,4-mannosyltransferase
VTSSRGDARARLDLPVGSTILLCIGTLAPHKGVDRVIGALARTALPGVELHVVGRPIRPMPDALHHAEELRRLAADTPGVYMHERYVSDEEFDLWIRAADVVVTAYRSAASSGVVERAHLLGTPLLTSGAGGIGEQVREGDIQFEDDAALEAGIRRIARGA